MFALYEDKNVDSMFALAWKEDSWQHIYFV